MFGLPSVCLAAAVFAQVPPPPPPPAPRPATVVGGLQTGQARDQNQRQPLIGKSSLAGIVVNESGRPVKGARVALGGGPVSRSEISSATGEFFFDKLPEGRYGLNANRTRYLSGSYGQKRPERSGTTIQLADGEQKKDLRITLFSG